MNQKYVALVVVAVCNLFTYDNSTFAQGTAFTYQGLLHNNGSPANGNYDFTFALCNNSTTNTGQVGTMLTNLDVGVTNGLFTVTLDFGAYFPGANRWLAIGVRTNGGGGFIALSPLQELTPTPYCHLCTQCQRGSWRQLGRRDEHRRKGLRWRSCQRRC